MFSAHIEHEFIGDTLRFYVRDVHGGFVDVYEPDGHIRTYELGANHAPVMKPALEIPRDAAPALLAALAKFLGAVEHPEQLRKDYDAERARVDRLIGALMTERR